MINKQIHIGIVDDHPLFREGVVRTLQAETDFEIVGEAVDAAQAICLGTDKCPDVMLLDMKIPGGGLNAARAILQTSPDLKIIVLTASDAARDVLDALDAGARGYILKGVSGEELVRVVRGVYAGETYVTPTLAATLLTDRSRARKEQAAARPLDELTKREHEILTQVAAGLSNKEIAHQLVLSEQTIKHYVTNIFQKLQVRNRVEAALLASSTTPDLSMRS